MRIEAFLLFVASGAGASPFVVTTSLDTVDALAGDGLCADAQGACSLRAAVQESNAWPGADAIRAPAGTYMLTNAGALEDFAATGDLDIAGPVEIVGAGASLTIVDGNSLDTVFEFHPATVAAGLHALTVRGGIGATPCSQGDCRSAGGIVNRPGVALRLRDVELRENRAGGLHASAILNLGCLDAQRIRVIANAGVEPGDALAAVATSPHLATAPSCMMFDQAEFSGNSAMQAGALFANNAEVELRRSLVAGNHSVQGAALVFNFGNEVLIENVTIAGNQGGSGAILNDGWSDLRIRHATITGNSGGNSGGIHDVHGGFGQVILSNTLLTGNHAAQAAQDDCNGWLVSAGGTLVGTEVGAGTQPGLPCQVQPGAGDQYPVDLVLDAPADHGGFTHGILPVVPAIDAGIADECTATDQRGWLRPAGIACDAGAIELGAVADTLFADGFDAATAFSALRRGAAAAARRDARSAR